MCSAQRRRICSNGLLSIWPGTPTPGPPCWGPPCPRSKNGSPRCLRRRNDRRSSPHAFERVLVVAHAVVHFAQEQVSFRVGGDAVDVEELAGVVPRVAADRSQQLQRL